MVPFQHGFKVVREFLEQVPWIMAKVLLDDVHHDRVHNVRQQAPCFAVRSSSSFGHLVQNLTFAQRSSEHLHAVAFAMHKPGDVTFNHMRPSRG